MIKSISNKRDEKKIIFEHVTTIFKAFLAYNRNATRDYLDFAALADHLGADRTLEALRRFDDLYPQPNEDSALQQLQIQLSNPLPYDLDDLDLTEYKRLDARWADWRDVKTACIDCANLIFDHIVGVEG